MIDETGKGFDFENEFEDERIILESEADLGDFAAPEAQEVFQERHTAFSRAAGLGRERLYDAADRSKGRLADAIETAADRLDGQLSQTADYLRRNDVEVISQDFVQQVRRHPLLSAGLAVGAGYLVGKAFGGGSRRGKRSKAGTQLRRALVSGVAAMVAARSNGPPKQ